MTKAVVCAYGMVGTYALRALLEMGVPLSAVYTYQASPEDNWFMPPAVLAEEHGVPVFYAQDFNADSVYAEISALQPEILFSCYFRDIIAERLLKLPRLGAYNLHGSLLPQYRGRAPINWVLVKGETVTGVTLHAMTAKPDAGEIVAQVPLEIAWDETALSLTKQCAQAAYRLMHQAVPQLLAGKASLRPQLGVASYFGRRRPEDGELNSSFTVAQAFNLIRAVADPWPNALLPGNPPLQIAWGLPSRASCPPGYFRITPEGVLLGFIDGALMIHAMRYHGVRSERPSDHWQWLRDWVANNPERPWIGPCISSEIA